MKTIEDTLTEDLVTYWNTSRPAGLPAGWEIYHAKREEERTVPCVVIGDEGAARVAGMPDTGRVQLRVMPLSSPDEVSSAMHREITGVMDEALRVLLELTRGFDATGAPVTAVQPLANCHVHELLPENPDRGYDTDKRQEFTVLKRLAVVSRYRG